MIVKLSLIFVVLYFLVISDRVFSQDDQDSTISIDGAPKIFLDCEKIDFDYLRRNIKFVTYVRERQLADIFIQGNSRRTAGGGSEYTFSFSGNNQFAGSTDTLTFFSSSLDTEEIFRRKLIKILKLGLMQFVLETPIADNLSFKLDESIGETIESVKDKWDYWVFRIRFNGEFSGEQSHDNYELGGHLNADRITEDWKIRFDTDVNYREENFLLEEGGVSWHSISRSYKSDFDIVKSISSHFSIGGKLRFLSSTYNNIQSSYEVLPAIEYNIFPYAESIYRQIRISYFIGGSSRVYHDKTIYDKNKENLVKQGVGLNFEMKEPWGQIDVRGEYSNYFHDLQKSRIDLWGWFSINMFEGFSFDFGGGYSKIHDQLSLSKEDLDIEEILLSRTELATQYSYHLSIGLSYSFGAMFNNIVNPRFGD